MDGRSGLPARPRHRRDRAGRRRTSTAGGRDVVHQRMAPGVGSDVQHLPPCRRGRPDPAQSVGPTGAEHWAHVYPAGERHVVAQPDQRWAEADLLAGRYVDRVLVETLRPSTLTLPTAPVTAIVRCRRHDQARPPPRDSSPAACSRTLRGGWPAAMTARRAPPRGTPRCACPGVPHPGRGSAARGGPGSLHSRESNPVARPQKRRWLPIRAEQRGVAGADEVPAAGAVG